MYEQIIKHYPDFPTEGIDFIDLIPILQNKEVFSNLLHEIDHVVTTPNVVTVEARGFLFASPLLVASNKVQTLVPIRKKGKLPFDEDDLKKVSIEKEYGSDEVFYRVSDLAKCVSSNNIIEITLFDDFLATGGTAHAIAEYLNNEVVEGKRVVVKEFIFLAELDSLNARQHLQTLAPVHTFMHF